MPYPVPFTYVDVQVCTGLLRSTEQKTTIEKEKKPVRADGVVDNEVCEKRLGFPAVAQGLRYGEPRD